MLPCSHAMHPSRRESRGVFLLAEYSCSQGSAAGNHVTLSPCRSFSFVPIPMPHPTSNSTVQPPPPQRVLHRETLQYKPENPPRCSLSRLSPSRCAPGYPCVWFHCRQKKQLSTAVLSEQSMEKRLSFFSFPGNNSSLSVRYAQEVHFLLFPHTFPDRPLLLLLLLPHAGADFHLPAG